MQLSKSSNLNLKLKHHETVFQIKNFIYKNFMFTHFMFT